MNKEEMVVTICNTLNEHEFQDTDRFGYAQPYTCKSGFGAGLMYMPEENLKRIIDCPIDDWSDFSKVYAAWGRAGALRFEPYMTDENKNPTLVIRHNRYLHMFRGYHFQVSGTVDGIVDCGSGSYRTDFLIHRDYSRGILRNGLIAYMLWWSALIDAGFRYDNFIQLFDTHKEVIEEFLHASMKFWRSSMDYSWEDVEKYIKVGTGNIDVCKRKMYQLQNDDGTVSAYLAIGLETIQVETAMNRLVTITVPDVLEGSGYDVEDEDAQELIDDEIGTLEENHFHEMLLVMAAKLAGIEINFNGYYFLRKRVGEQNMRPINSPEVIKVHSLDEIYGCKPDEF